MQTFDRDLHLFLDGREAAQGCHMFLTAHEFLTLRPALHSLLIYDLSDSSAALLSGARRVELRSGNSVLAFGDPAEVYTCLLSGRQVTSLVFSPGLSLWQSSVSLSLATGMTVSASVRALLSAAADLPSPVSLAAFTAEDYTFTRPQAFFGRTCDALASLAETVNADAFLSSAGLCVSGRHPAASAPPTIVLPESDLLAAPRPAGSDSLILTTRVAGWPLGSILQTSVNSKNCKGRLVSRLIRADNRDGPWKSELELIGVHA